MLFADLLTANSPPIEILRYISEKLSSIEIKLLYWNSSDDNDCCEVNIAMGTCHQNKPIDKVDFIRTHFDPWYVEDENDEDVSEQYEIREQKIMEALCSLMGEVQTMVLIE
jgi:hypothetical protein